MQKKERRLHRRYKIAEPTLVEFKRRRFYQKRNRIIATGLLFDISLGGAAVTYAECDDGLENISKITILNEQEAVKIIRNLPVDTVDDLGIGMDRNGHRIRQRRMRFVNLTDYHKACLDILLSIFNEDPNRKKNPRKISDYYDSEDIFKAKTITQCSSF